MKSKFIVENIVAKVTEFSESERINTAFNDVGLVETISDGIVSIKGLNEVTNGEMVGFVTKSEVVFGLVLNLETSRVKAIIIGNYSNIKIGCYVLRKFDLLSVPTGYRLLGRVVDPLGQPIDGKGSIIEDSLRYVESRAPSITLRTSVNQPLETGLKIIDCLVPIGHGQRQLIIGDAKTGKTSIVIDTILNQRDKGTICVYVAIGQKKSAIARIVKFLIDHDCMKFCVIVAAMASDSAAVQFIAPYSACSMAEFFMHNNFNTLIVYDDLSKHAVAYRQLSLLLRRPPGREGYPGDIFYLHSRLLERAANLLDAGSLTALPIVETIQGDVSAYIPTNIISITDGQIFLEADLFTRGIRPAVNPGLSVSRVGSAAQNNVLKNISGSLKLELAQYREVEEFTKVGFTLDEATKVLVERGIKLTRLLVQKRYDPLNIVEQTLFLFAAFNGYLEDIELDDICIYERELYFFFRQSAFYEPLCILLRETMDLELVDCFLSFFVFYFYNYYFND